MKQSKAVAHIKDRLKRRKRDRRFGLGMLIFGFLVLLDSPYLFPIPLVGLPSVILSACLLTWAIFHLYRGCRLPIQEAALFMYHQHGEALRAEILSALDGEEGNGEQLFKVLETKDLAMPASHDMVVVESRDSIPGSLMILLPGGKEMAERILKNAKVGDEYDD